MSTLKIFNSRKILTKFRLSDHKLEIEIGRYKKVPREQRICKACKVLDDEKHFFLHCHTGTCGQDPMLLPFFCFFVFKMLQCGHVILSVT
jgi:hypothetical protein